MMLDKAITWYRRKKNGGYLGGIKSIFERIEDLDKIVQNDLNIVEVGSERGVGSTYNLAKYANKKGLSFVTIDPDPNSFASAKSIVEKFKNPKLTAVKDKGETYLKDYPEQNILLAYLDGFDVIFPGHQPSQDRIDAYANWGIDLVKDGNRLSAEVHLQTTKYIYDKVVQGGWIAFDDTYKEGDEWYGKGATAVPFLLENEYELVNNAEREPNHSIVMQKK